MREGRTVLNIKQWAGHVAIISSPSLLLEVTFMIRNPHNHV